MIRNLRSALMALLLVPAAVAAQEREQPPTVTVSANSFVLREPDRARVMLAVESMAPTAREAARENARKMERVIASLVSQGIDRKSIRTVSYNLNPEYDYRQERRPQQQLVGYRAVNMVQVIVDDIARVGGVLDETISAGANRVASLGFELRDSESAYLEAVANATRKARAEAEAAAGALGMRVGQPMNISTGRSYHQPPPMPMMAEARMEAVAAPPQTPIETGELRIGAQVHAVFRLEPAR